MKDELNIVKVGGKLIEDETALDNVLGAFASMKSPKLLVHGGGNKASELESRLGLKPRMVGGRRITSLESLDVVVMVYAGLLNKNLVASLQGRGCIAIGMSGADGDLVRARKRPVSDLDYGYAGDVTGINLLTLQQLLEAGLSPVVCALSHNGKGQLLNTNADTIATEIAIAASNRYKTQLHYCFDLPGVLEDPNDPGSVIQELNLNTYKSLREEGVISGGMLPKLDNCFRALEYGVSNIRIGGSQLISGAPQPHTVLMQ